MSSHLATLGRAHAASAGLGRGAPAAASWPLVEGRVVLLAGRVYADVAGHRRGPLRWQPPKAGVLPPAGAVCLVALVPDGRDWLLAVDGWTPA